MPAYNNTGGDNMYSDDPEQGSEPKSPQKDEEYSGETTLVPSSLCPGMKVGDEMVVKIVRIMDDQYEIAYAPEKGKSGPAEESEPAPASGKSDLASMME